MLASAAYPTISFGASPIAVYLPVPSNLTACGSRLALSSMDNTPCCFPLDVGMKVTSMAHFAPASSTAGQFPVVALNSAASGGSLSDPLPPHGWYFSLAANLAVLRVRQRCSRGKLLRSLCRHTERRGRRSRQAAPPTTPSYHQGPGATPSLLRSDW